MNKKLTILLVLLCFFVKSEAQMIEKNSKGRVGMRMGFGISSFKGEELDNYRPYFGYQFGIVHKMKLSKKVQFRYEVIADLRGSKFKVLGDSSYSKISTMYINFPLEFSYTYRKTDKVENEFYAGFQISRILISRIFKGVDLRPVETNLPLKNFDYGITVGHAWNKKDWGFKIGIYTGLADINDGLNYKSVPGLKRTNKNIGTQSLNIGFVF